LLFFYQLFAVDLVCISYISFISVPVKNTGNFIIFETNIYGVPTGSFELAVLRMSRHYDLHRDCVYYADALLPADAFYTQDAVEKKLVSLAFEVSRSVASLKLTETELALYSAVVLLSPGWYLR